MSKEKELYELVESLDLSNMDGQGYGIHETSFVDCSFPEDAYGFRVYNAQGYCFDITWERQFAEDGTEVEPYYCFTEGVFDGFKDLTIDEAIAMIKNEGVFK